MTLEELSARLEKVERQNRRMRAGGLAALVVVAACAALPQTAAPPAPPPAPPSETAAPGATPSPRVLTAQGFVLVDKEGHPKAALELSPEGDPRLHMAGKEGRDQLTLATSSDGWARIGLSAGDGKASVHLRADPSGAAALEVENDAGTPLGTVGIRGGLPYVALHDPAFVQRMALGLSPDGSPLLRLAGRERGAETQVGSGGIGITDEDCRLRVSLGRTPEPLAGQDLHGDSSSARLVLYDPDGTVVGRLPK